MLGSVVLLFACALFSVAFAANTLVLIDNHIIRQTHSIFFSRLEGLFGFLLIQRFDFHLFLFVCFMQHKVIF